MPLVAINIVTFNSSGSIIQCLRAVKNQHFRDFSILVLDNASEDSTVESIRQVFPDVEIIENDSNDYYARAHNRMIAATESKYILTLNPDVLLFPAFLEKIMRVFEAEDDLGSASGLLIQITEGNFEQELMFEKIPPGSTVDAAGLLLKPSARQVLRFHGQKVENCDLSRCPILGPDGAAAFYRREMLEDIAIEGEIFDEDFLIHKEDVDVAWRATLRGWCSAFIPEAVAYHERGFKPGRRSNMLPVIRKLSVRNRWLMNFKNMVLKPPLPSLLPVVIYDILILGYLILFEQRSLAALPDFLKKLPGMLRKRKAVKEGHTINRDTMKRFITRGVC